MRRYGYKAASLRVVIAGLICGLSLRVFGQTSETPVDQRTFIQEYGGVRVEIRYLTDEDLKAYSQIIRPIVPNDFGAILKDRYINYARDRNAQLLILYNLYSRYPQPLLFDEFGWSLTVERGWAINPYLDSEGRARFEVFSVTLRNGRAGKIGLDPSLIVAITERGNQLRPLSLEEIEAEVGLSIAFGRRTPHLYGFRSLYPPGYRDVLLQKRVLSETLLRDKRVYPGAQAQGLVLFAKGRERITRLIIPEITFFEGNRIIERWDFEFILSTP